MTCEKKMKKRSKSHKSSTKSNPVKQSLNQSNFYDLYNSNFRALIEKEHYSNRSFIKLPKTEKIKILKDDLYREAYRLAEFLTADSSREGFVR